MTPNKIKFCKIKLIYIRCKKKCEDENRNLKWTEMKKSQQQNNEDKYTVVAV